MKSSMKNNGKTMFLAFYSALNEKFRRYLTEGQRLWEYRSVTAEGHIINEANSQCVVDGILDSAIEALFSEAETYSFGFDESHKRNWTLRYNV